VLTFVNESKVAEYLEALKKLYVEEPVDKAYGLGLLMKMPMMNKYYGRYLSREIIIVNGTIVVHRIPQRVLKTSNVIVRNDEIAWEEHQIGNTLGMLAL
jgi:hypothetical protein